MTTWPADEHPFHPDEVAQARQLFGDEELIKAMLQSHSIQTVGEMRRKTREIMREAVAYNKTLDKIITVPYTSIFSLPLN